MRTSNPAPSRMRFRFRRMRTSSSTTTTRSGLSGGMPYLPGGTGTGRSYPVRRPKPARGSRTPRNGGWSAPGGPCLAAVQEVVVGLELGELLEEPLHGLDGLQRGEGAAKLADLLDLLAGEELLLLAGARGADVDGREDPALGQRPGEDDLHVPGALELLEDHLVHAAAGVDEGGADDGEGAALLGLAGRAEEPLRALQRAAVDAAGEGAPGRLDLAVVGAGEPGDRVEQDDDVLASLDEPLGALHGHLGRVDVLLGRPVVGGAADLALHVPAHVGELLGALVDEEDDEVDVGAVGVDRLGDPLQHDGLAGLGRRGDEGAGAEADGGDEVEDAADELVRTGLHDQLLGGVGGGEVREGGSPDH